MRKVLLTTVCGPFGADTEDCTRHVMPELYHAQVTRAQGVFSIRSTYISYGLEYIANNITTPTTVLQYPTMKQFKRELRKGYDYVGINLEWGQSGDALRQYLIEHPDAVPNPVRPQAGHLVVGGSDLVRILDDPDRYAWLRENFKPVDTIAYSHFVYEISSLKLAEMCDRTQACE